LELWGEKWPENSEFHAISGFFYMPKICDMGQDGFCPEKFDGFGWV
jgi:hypothetical protein